ncbi:glycosyltransferase family 2 protein [Hyphobacterium sp. CCMP332]|uniref:glycosyltransferase family 2 protein n=1 Tax=Hyphobacterium sp. CCMP332 TaxID=2749086 RepID=UPI0016509F50|nr:glycosyltransferase family A protein [Hyphobacterium sp. CCMP332]QNL17883.1 glycosyltransferase family 2 protein [Hyphobacterium sp. CCMP332]
MTAYTSGYPRPPYSAFALDPADLTLSDFASFALTLSEEKHSESLEIWTPPGANIQPVRSAFAFFGLSVCQRILVVPKGFHPEAPALHLAEFALSLLLAAQSNPPDKFYVAGPGGAGVFAAEAYSCGEGPSIDVLAGTSGLCEQLEARRFPESPKDLLRCDLEMRTMRLAATVRAPDPLLAETLKKLLNRSVAAAVQISSVARDANGTILLVPHQGLLDIRLTCEILSEAAPRRVIIAETPFTTPFDMRNLKRNLNSIGIDPVSVRCADIQSLSMLCEAESAQILSLREMRALEPIAASLASRGFPVIGGLGPSIIDPGPKVAGIKFAPSYASKLAPLVDDPSIQTTWAGPAAKPAGKARAVLVAKMKRIAIVIATHDRSKMLMEALASVAESDMKPDEVIVIDDGSSTLNARENAQICEAFAACPLRYFRTENFYPGHARNYGVAESSADWIFFLDDDNRLKPDAIATIRRTQAETRCAAVFSFLDSFEGTQAHRVVPFFGPAGLSSLFQNHVGDTGFAIERRTFERINGFPETFGVGKEDYAVLSALARAEIDYRMITRPLYEYRVHADRIEKNHRRRSIGAFANLTNVYPMTDRSGHFRQDGLFERLAFMQAAQLSMRHVPDRPSLRLSPFQVFLHHGLRVVLRQNKFARRILRRGLVGELIRRVFFNSAR